MPFTDSLAPCNRRLSTHAVASSDHSTLQRGFHSLDCRAIAPCAPSFRAFMLRAGRPEDAFEKTWDRVSDGGIVVVDDFFHKVQGPARASAEPVSDGARLLLVSVSTA